MAGDWLKVEANTPEKEEVLAITARMGWDDPDLTVGKLFRLWRWFDQHTVNGNATRVTSALLDRVVGVGGFCAAVQEVGWIAISADGLTLPRFDRHNGTTAKSRALTAKRVANHKAKGNAEANGAGNALTVSGALPREEKRREEVRDTEAIASAAAAAQVDRQEAVFALGVPLLTSAGVPERSARSFLGRLRKFNTDAAVLLAIDRCVKAHALQPIEFLQGCLKTSKHFNSQEALEESNRAVGDRWLAEQERADATH